MATARSPQWDPEQYESRFSFVWKHGAALLDLLAPQKGESILDLGCGPGQLSADIAARGAHVIGLDSAAPMIAQARINYPRLKFMLADATSFSLAEPVDAVFSNASLHWIKDPGAVVACIRKALRPGGRFVAEFGGRGNVATILQAVLDEVPGAQNPWYFPRLGEYATLLEAHGFRVTDAAHFDRPTALEGPRGMDDWLDMFGGELLSSVKPAERNAARDRIVQRLRPSLCRDGVWFADYVRLRIVACT